MASMKMFWFFVYLLGKGIFNKQDSPQHSTGKKTFSSSYKLIIIRSKFLRLMPEIGPDCQHGFRMHYLIRYRKCNCFALWKTLILILFNVPSSIHQIQINGHEDDLSRNGRGIQGWGNQNK